MTTPTSPSSEADALREILHDLWQRETEHETPSGGATRFSAWLLNRFCDQVYTATPPAPAQADAPMVRDEAAYMAGWIVASRWSGRSDLLADIDSPAYVRDRDAALLSAAPSVPSQGDAGGRDGWMRMTTAPNDGTEVLAAIRVFDTRGKFSHWERHVVAFDDEIGSVSRDTNQGWRWEDYEFWQPIPPPPSTHDAGGGR